LAVKPIPEGYPRLMPYLAVEGAASAIDFYTDVFGATERVRMDMPDGKVGHAELQIGDSVLMLADSFPDMNPSPAKIGGTPVTLTVYVENVDDTFARAIKRGATELRAVEDRFYGDRAGELEDPFGHRWSIMTHVEDVTPEQMKERMAAMGGG